MIKKIIDFAKSDYPSYIEYADGLTRKELNELKKVCDVTCSGINNGKWMYKIRYNYAAQLKI